MAIDLVPKQTSFTQRYVSMVAGLMNIADTAQMLDNEFTDNAYGTGGMNAIGDVVVQSVCPAATAAEFNEAEGAVVAILATVSANRGYLEALRQ